MKFGEADGDAGPIFPTACMGHRDYIGGGKSPPPIVTLVQHAGDLASAERAASCH